MGTKWEPCIGDRVRVKQINDGDRFVGFDGPDFKKEHLIQVVDFETGAIVPDKMAVVDARQPPTDMLNVEGEIVHNVSFDFGFSGYAVRFNDSKLVLPYEVAEALMRGENSHRIWLFTQDELEPIQTWADRVLEKHEEENHRIKVVSS